MKCEEFMALLPLYPDALPSAKAAQDIATHATQCPECAARLSQQEALLGALQTLDDSLTVPEAFGEAWRLAIAGDSGSARQSHKHKRRIWAVAAAAVLVLVSGTMLMRNGLIFSPPKLDRQSRTYSAENSPVSQADIGAATFFSEDEAQAYGDTLFLEDDAGSLSFAGSSSSVLLRTASITLETEQYDADIERIEALLAETGGWSEHWSVYGEPFSDKSDGGRYASLTLRIPEDTLEQFVSAVGEVGKITGSLITTEDISENYYDVQGRLAMYEAQRDRFTQLLSQAENVSEIMEIESRLNELQYTIESLVGKLNNWTSLSANAMVTLSVTEVPPGGKYPEPSITQRIQRAFTLSLSHARGFLGDMLVFFIMIAPYLLCIAVPVLVVYLIIRMSRKYRQRSKEK